MSTEYLPDVPLAKIKPHPKNPRLELTGVDELAADIAAKGVLQPLVLAPPAGSSAAYTLIAGHRRLAAAKAAGLTSVPATLRDDLDTPAKQLAAILSENTQRVDLTPVEEADAFSQLCAFPEMTQAKAAKLTGRSPAFVKQRIALSKLPDAARKKMHSGEITIHDAGVIASFVGTPDYKAITAAAGTPNFRFAVQRAKDNTKARANNCNLCNWLNDDLYATGPGETWAAGFYAYDIDLPDGAIETSWEYDYYTWDYTEPRVIGSLIGRLVVARWADDHGLEAA